MRWNLTYILLDYPILAVFLLAASRWTDAWVVQPSCEKRLVHSISSKSSSSNSYASLASLPVSRPNQHCLRQIRTVMKNKESDGDDNQSSHSPSGKKYSSARLGGRKRKALVTKNDKDDDDDKNMQKFKKWATLLAPILVACVLLKSLLFGGGDNPSYVYYQSSIYESRTYGADGQLETSRKESFRSNIPALIEGRQKDGQSSYLLRQNVDEGFERALDSFILKSQESFLDEFF